MNMPTRFNAAQRLLEIVGELKAAPHTSPTWKVYLSVCGTGTNKTDSLMFAYELAKLANEVERTIKSSENVPDELLSSLKPLLNQCLELNLDKSWSQCLGNFSPESTVALQAYANFFTSVCNETRLTKEQYNELTSELDKISSAVDSCKHDELRAILLSIIESARRAIFLYKINGAKPFADTFDLALGKLIIQYQRETFSRGENQETVGKVFQFMSKLRQICSTVNALLALPAGFSETKKALGLG